MARELATEIKSGGSPSLEEREWGSGTEPVCRCGNHGNVASVWSNRTSRVAFVRCLMKLSKMSRTYVVHWSFNASHTHRREAQEALDGSMGSLWGSIRPDPPVKPLQLGRAQCTSHVMCDRHCVWLLLCYEFKSTPTGIHELWHTLKLPAPSLTRPSSAPSSSRYQFSHISPPVVVLPVAYHEQRQPSTPCSSAFGEEAAAPALSCSLALLQHPMCRLWLSL